MTRYGELKAEYESSTKSVHEDITDFIYPKGGRFEDKDSDPTDGRRREENIIDSTATIALRTLISGMYSFITSPATKWFLMTIDDKELQEVAIVKDYFDKVTNTLLSILGASNFYTNAEVLYGELGAYGTSAIQIEADSEKIVRFRSYTIGQYYLDTNFKGIPDTIYRLLRMRARNVVAQFGEENVSDKVKAKLIPPKTGSDWVEILHVQEPNPDRDPNKVDSKNKPFLSTYHEMSGADNQKPLRESGYDTQPFAAPRWYVAGDSVWGVGPGEDALGDVKMLQQQQNDKLDATAKNIDKPVIADSGAGDIMINAGAGGVTWINGVTAGKEPAVVPLYAVDVDQNALRQDIIETQNRIRSVFFADILFFLAAASDPRKTATQINAEQREQLRLMGPIVERLFPEYLLPVLDRVFDIARQIPGLLPDPPREIQGREIKIEIISLISQAQRLTEVTPIEQVLAAAINMAQTFPEVTDKINADQIIDELGKAYGAPSGIINSDEVVAQIRQARNAQIQQQQAQAQAQGAISSAKELSETDVSGDNALTALAGGA
jgi:hypothetical protein